MQRHFNQLATLRLQFLHLDMRRIFFFLIVLAVVFSGGAVFVPASHAQTCEAGCSLDESAQCVPVGGRTVACKPPSVSGAAADLSAIGIYRQFFTF